MSERERERLGFLRRVVLEMGKEATLPFLSRRYRLSTWRPMDRFLESGSHMPTCSGRYWVFLVWKTLNDDVF